ncbi:SGNH/GDSL hydrolase family protein [Kutzneria kofuensis]|uniref:Lysophospholipase L1-like esterase n=1 Tax=Kutzneria kofuensis TaxID=103725 RepID=A0A7W9KP29_9PSEU|nr:SGNH/GDSL hydrolase family protein [Kutzneria kofuensis]MBB5896111.1 lysophospholipase L1-like esterase [Kutzneria kofuensis]
MKRTQAAALAAAASIVLALPGTAAASTADTHWVTGWSASPVVGSAIPGSTCPAGTGLTDQTVRNVVFLSAGGDHVRVRLTNTFGTKPLAVDHASVAVQGSGATPVAGTMRELTFHGRRTLTVPPGVQEFSDPVPLRVTALSTLLVSAHVAGTTGPLTNHPFTAQGNYLAGGDATLAADAARFGDTPCWMLADGVDVTPSAAVTGTVVAFGDSITDTATTTGNANRRWPDFLARRLAALPGRTLSVANAGLGGNRVLADRPGQPYYGVAGVTRFQRDALGITGVRTVILLEGVNDIGYDASAGDIVAGYRRMIAAAHAAGVRIVGATLTPFGGSFLDTPEHRQTWQRLNDWIRHSGAFDGVVDFAVTTADPADPFRMRPAYDSGDHLHPGDAGTRAMADTVDLTTLLGR